MRADKAIEKWENLCCHLKDVGVLNYIDQLRYERLMAKAMYFYEYQDWFDQNMKKHNQCFHIAEAFEARAKRIKEGM